MMRLRIILSSANIMLAASVVVGLFLPQALSAASALILPALILMLTVTLLRFPRGFFRHPAALLPGALWGNFLNYMILGNLILLGSLFHIRDEPFWIGMVLVAAVPPAVIAIPLGKNIGTDSLRLFSGLAGAHAGALLIIPLIGLAFLKYIPIGIDKIILLTFGLIALPLLLSRLAVDRNVDACVEKYESVVTNVCYAVIFYALSAANATAIRSWSVEIPLIVAIALGSLAVVIVAVIALVRLTGMPRERWSFFLLLGSLKNYGLAGGIALWIFGAEAALPALVFSAVMIAYTTVLKMIYPARQSL